MSNVIYTDSPKIEINSFKRFERAFFEEGIHIASGLLNDFHVQDIVTKSTKQDLHIPELYGDVLFKNLELDGKFGLVNVTDLDYNSIKLWGDQYTQAELNFENDDSLLLPELQVNYIAVLEDLNDLTASSFIRTDQPSELLGEVSFNDLQTDECLVYGNIQSSNLLNGVSMDVFEQTRLSITRPQAIDSANIKHALVAGILKNDFINGIETNIFTNRILKSQSVRNLLFSGEIVIDNLHVTGNVAVNQLNGRDLNLLMEEAIWLNKPNRIPGGFTFLDPAFVRHNLTAYGFVNQKVLSRFVNDLVLKTHNPIVLNDAKVFKHGFHVLGNLDTNYLNSVPSDSYMRKMSDKPLPGPVNVYGKVIAKNVDIGRSLNNISVAYLKQTYGYDPETSAHVIKGDANFYSGVSIGHLEAHGSFNDVPDISAYLGSILRDDADAEIHGAKNFLSSTYFHRGLDVKLFNHQDLSELVSQIVTVDQPEPINIGGLVKFLEPVSAPEVEIEHDLATHNIADCSPTDMFFNGLQTTRNEKFFGKLNLLECAPNIF